MSAEYRIIVRESWTGSSSRETIGRGSFIDNDSATWDIAPCVGVEFLVRPPAGLSDGDRYSILDSKPGRGDSR